ncbi:hypothetical protein T4B_10404 [Trichinella pseudospiralis]|uniref:Uncharacterized protein n=1 Tax=Trichinella pseudospiralis TaxID=6337 RepID=A0A0V1H033_TRIPS|nr:hypothetical protein T4B_10404 [Trichinella pseudospiralis]
MHSWGINGLQSWSIAYLYTLGNCPSLSTSKYSTPYSGTLKMLVVLQNNFIIRTSICKFPISRNR